MSKSHPAPEPRPSQLLPLPPELLGLRLPWDGWEQQGSQS